MRCRCGWQFDEAIVARYGCPRCDALGFGSWELEEQAYRKRPVVVRARRMPEAFTVETLEGTMQGNAGDWLVTGVKGEQYPVDDEIFRATYELADE